MGESGFGIAPEGLEQVTVPFTQFEDREHIRRLKALKRDASQTGTGLGLPLVKMLTARIRMSRAHILAANSGEAAKKVAATLVEGV